MLDFVSAVVKHVGRRGVALLTFGVVDLAMSYSLMYKAIFPPLVNSVNAIDSIPGGAHVWSPIWLISGIICIAQAFMRVDKVGFTVTSGIKFAWASGLIAVWLSGLAKGAWVSGLTWAVIAIFIVITAAAPELTEIPTLQVVLPVFEDSLFGSEAKE